MKRIGLIDADLMDNGTRHPNLALMKLAGYYKSMGHEVTLIYNNYEEVKRYDKVFISKVFSFTKVPKWVIELEHVKIGGTGFFPDGGENLSYEIEHHMPYYDLYKEYVEGELALGKRRSRFADYLDYSIGFTTRGCFRKCSFCVNKKYNRAFIHSPVSEFLDDKRPFVYLWDDNILAFENWEEVLNDIEATGKQFQFRQGIDIRLMTDKKAKRFNDSKYHGDFIFAFDHIQDREKIIEKVQLWKRYSTKICKMYVISGYESQDAEDIRGVFERIKILMKYGSLPYIMRYEDYKKSKYRGMYVQLARWCNQPNFFKKKSFREFCVANQEYHSNKETNCAAYQAMLDFEKDCPEIAAEYFDLKFEEENMYKFQYGFGRRYANKHLCNTCIRRNITWESIKNNEVDEKEVLKLYFTKQIDLQCCNYENSICNNIDLYSKYIVDLLLRTKVEDIIDCISKSDDLEDILTRERVKLQDHNEALFTIIEFLSKDSNRIYTLKELSTGIGKDYNDKSLKDMEENLKFAALLDLVQKIGSNSKAKVVLSNLGKAYSSCSKDEKEKLILRLLFRIPKIQQEFIKENVNKYVNIPKILKYRGSNLENMVKLIDNNI